MNNSLETSSSLFLLPSTVLQVSAGSGTSAHSHTAAQIIMALSGKLKVRISPKVAYSACDAVMIPPNVNHHVIGSGSAEVMIWFDPATIEARAICSRSLSELIPLSRNEINISVAKLLHLSSHLQTCSEAIKLSQIITQALLPEYKTIKPLDERIVFTISTFQDSALLSLPHPLKYLAQKVIQYKIGVGIVEIGSLSTMLAILWLCRQKSLTFCFTFGALLMLVAAFLVWGIFIEPINTVVDTWTVSSFPNNLDAISRSLASISHC